MKCETCRKADVYDSTWDKIRIFFFHFFHKDIIDLSQDNFTQGFADGYVAGRKHEHESAKRLAKELWNIDL